jgi:hypothetical protein
LERVRTARAPNTANQKTIRRIRRIVKRRVSEQPYGSQAMDSAAPIHLL